MGRVQLEREIWIALRRGLRATDSGVVWKQLEFEYRPEFAIVVLTVPIVSFSRAAVDEAMGLIPTGPPYMIDGLEIGSVFIGPYPGEAINIVVVDSAVSPATTSPAGTAAKPTAGSTGTGDTNDGSGFQHGYKVYFIVGVVLLIVLLIVVTSCWSRRRRQRMGDADFVLPLPTYGLDQGDTVQNPVFDDELKNNEVAEANVAETPIICHKAEPMVYTDGTTAASLITSMDWFTLEQPQAAEEETTDFMSVETQPNPKKAKKLKGKVTRGGGPNGHSQPKVDPETLNQIAFGSASGAAAATPVASEGLISVTFKRTDAGFGLRLKGQLNAEDTSVIGVYIARMQPFLAEAHPEVKVGMRIMSVNGSDTTTSYKKNVLAVFKKCNTVSMVLNRQP